MSDIGQSALNRGPDVHRRFSSKLLVSSGAQALARRRSVSLTHSAKPAASAGEPKPIMPPALAAASLLLGQQTSDPSLDLPEASAALGTSCFARPQRRAARLGGKPRRRNRRHRGDNRRVENCCGLSVTCQRQKSAPGIGDEPDICLRLRFGDCAKFNQATSAQA